MRSRGAWRPGRAGLRRLNAGARWLTAGLVDQAVIALANAATTLLALTLLDRHRAGVMVLSLQVAYTVMYLGRAFVGDVLLTLAARYDGQQRDRLFRDGLAAAGMFGLAAAGVLLAFWAVWPRGGRIDFSDLIWVVPFLPAVLVHDTGRSSYLANHRPDRALGIDVVWVATQAVAVTVVIVFFEPTAGGIFTCWGLGAVAGAVVFCVRSGYRPWRGDPRRWVGQTRHLSGWFTATMVVGQFQVQAVGILVAWQLSARELAGLRAAQTTMIQPVQNLISAMMGLFVPRSSRLARDAARLDEPAATGAAATLRRQTRLLALAFGGLAVLVVAVVWPLASAVLVRIDKFADIAPLALPMTLQAGLYLVQMPFTAALRGMHRARMLFGQYVAFTAASLTGLVVGASRGGLVGAAWGLTAGALFGLVTMVGLYFYALRWLGTEELPAELDPMETPGTPGAAGAPGPGSAPGSGSGGAVAGDVPTRHTAG